MLRKLLLIISLFVSVQLVAQMPNWYLPASRKTLYPECEWYIGYVEGSLNKNETLEDAMLRLKNSARVELISTISTSINYAVNAQIERYLFENSTLFDEQIRETSIYDTKIKSQIENIPDMQVDVFYNKENNVISAFAYLNRQRVCETYFNQQQYYHSKINAIANIIDYLNSKNELFQAREELDKADEYLKLSEENFKWLLLFSCENKRCENLLEQQILLNQLITQKQLGLINTVSIYFDCKGDMLDVPCTSLIEKVKMQLSQTSCSFVESPHQADWIVSLTTQAQIDNAHYDSVFCYVRFDVSGTIQKTKDKVQYGIYKTAYEGVPKTTGDGRLIVRITLERKDALVNDITKSILEILRTK